MHHHTHPFFPIHPKNILVDNYKFTPDYVCRRCVGDKDFPLINGRPFDEAQAGDSTFQALDQFCYLGDMLSAGGSNS